MNLGLLLCSLLVVCFVTLAPATCNNSCVDYESVFQLDHHSSYWKISSSGFLATRQQGSELVTPAAYLEALQFYVSNLSDTDLCRRFLNQVQMLPKWALETPITEVALEEQRLILAIISQRYIVCSINLEPRSPCVLPANIAVQYWNVSKQLSRPPSVAYVDVVLNNCIQVEIQPQGETHFFARYTLSGLDYEKGFYEAHCEVEHVAALGVTAGIELMEMACAATHKSDKGLFNDLSTFETVTELLYKMTDTIRRMIVSLKHMYRYIPPSIFFPKIRPFFRMPSLGVVFSNVSVDAYKYSGPTGAQTTTLPFFDAILGLDITDVTLRDLMSQFSEFWPEPHRILVTRAKSCTALSRTARSSAPVSFIDQHNKLVIAYDDALTALAEFRAAHILHTETFITKLIPQEKFGTGGTEFNRYLCQHLYGTLRARVKDDVPSVAIPSSCYVAMSVDSLARFWSLNEFP